MSSPAQAGVPQGAPRGYVVYLVILMGLVSQMDSWLSLIESKAVPGILATFAVSASQFAFYQGLFGIIVFGVFFIAWFADAFGRKFGMLALVLVMGVPAILIVFLSSSLYVFLLLYSLIIMGTTSNLWEVPIAEEAPAKRRGINGSIAFLIGVIPLYAIIGTRIIDTRGWRWGYGVMFFFMLILIVMLLFMKEPRRWKETAEARGNRRLGVIAALKKLRRQDAKYILVATVVYLAWTIAFKMATTFGGFYFVEVLDYTDSQFNSILTVAGLLLPVSAIISGVLLDKVGRRFVLIVGSVGAIACFAALGATGIPAFYQGIYFFMAMVLAWIYVYLAEIFATEVRSTSIGVCVTGARLGYVVGPLLASLLTSAFPTMRGFWIVCGALMLAPLLTLLARPLETRGKTLEDIEVQR
jgi:SP family galactose:H+ symporter-like MFS transporter